ncbi:MAG: DUF4367 domain-containing protein [Methanosarcinaceae archaeon]|nr:DUF4367 domain-containing protein [Methanosarcinaceae archaeon]
MVKIKMLLVLLLVSSPLFVAGCVDEELTAEQIAEKMKQKEASIEDYSYTMHMTILFEGQEQVMEADVMYKKPNKCKTVQILPTETAGGISVFDGETMWIYDPNQNTVMTMDMPEIAGQDEMDYQKLINTILDESDFSVIGFEEFEGRTAYIIEMKSKDDTELGLFGNIEVWIDKETWMPLKMEMKDGDGNPIYSAEYRNFQINTGIPDEEFKFEIPEGAEIRTMDEFVLPERTTLKDVQEKTAFDILVPSNLPEGYEFKGAMVIENDVSEIVSMSYKNDDIFFEITEVVCESEPQGSPLIDSAESVSINGIDGKVISLSGDGNMLQWNLDNIQITIVGSLDKEELILIAESVQ